MNLLTLLLVSLPLLSGSVPADETSLELRSAKPDLLVGEPYDLRLALMNRGQAPVSVAPTFYSYPGILLITEDGQMDCETGVQGIRGAPDVKWEMIAPGAERIVDLPAFRCFCKKDQSTGCQDWLYSPGNYKLKVVLAHRPGDLDISPASAPPAKPLDGTFESNIVAIRVKEPTGVDAEALAWAKSIDEHPLSIKVINKFPTSTYAALVVYGKINLEGTDPVTVRGLIEKGQFPAWNSVPDPASPDGWTSLHGAEFARWQVQQAEQILREHPEFPCAGQLRLVAAVNSLSLGMKQQGMNVLRDLARRPEKTEGAWAKSFLSPAK